jgi:hypothetical protein
VTENKVKMNLIVTIPPPSKERKAEEERLKGRIAVVRIKS